MHEAPLRTRILQGIGLTVFLTIFKAAFEGPTHLTAWGWGILLVSVSFGGAVGGAAYYGSDSWRSLGGWHKTVANVGSILAYAAATVVAILLATLLVPSLRN